MPEEVLSQDAIDRLLREMAEGKTPQSSAPLADVSPVANTRTLGQKHTTNKSSASDTTVARERTSSRKIRDYDFRRPNRISKEHLRGLRLVHELFSREVPRVWSPLLRAGGQVKIISMEQTIYEEFRNHLSSRCLICTISMNPLEGEIAFHIELDAAYVLIDRLLGGTGSNMKHIRELTALELNILQKLIEVLLPAWRDAWLHIIHLEPTIARILSSSEFLQLTAANESVLVTTLQATFLNADIEMTICIPYVTIAPIMTRIVTSEKLPGIANTDVMDNERLQRLMQKIALSVDASLGAAPIPFAVLANLNAGDVIRLDVPMNGHAVVNVSGRPHFMARPGIFNGGLAVQITDILPDGLE